MSKSERQQSVFYFNVALAINTLQLQMQGTNSEYALL